MWSCSFNCCNYSPSTSERNAPITPAAEYLLHQPLGQMQGSASELEIHAKQILKTRAELNRLISDKTGHKLDVVGKYQTRFLDGCSESLEWGLVGKIVNNSSELPSSRILYKLAIKGILLYSDLLF